MNSPHEAIVIEKDLLAETFFPVSKDLEQYPAEYIKANKVLKLDENDAEVCIGICDIHDDALMENLSAFHKKKTRFFLISEAQLTMQVGRGIQYAGDKSGANSENNFAIDQWSADAPIVSTVNSMIIEALQSGASDIHIEAFDEEIWIRYRIDGALRTVQKLEKAKFMAISSRIKIMANLNIMETRLPQDGRTTVSIGNSSVDLRVSIVPIARGESIVLRIFNKNDSAFTLESLGLDAKILKSLRKILTVPHGLVLVTGPTGSGKSTTLNCLIQEIRDETLKIITIEDPIEYLVKGVDQIQTNEEIGLTFDTILRRVLRQDPDVIMVGEIRDYNTADLSIKAAMTGHLVFATLHTNDAVSAVHRLVNMGIEPYLLSSVLKGVLAQRLVRKICPHCKTEAEKESISGFSKYFGKNDTVKLFTGKGCSKCSKTGYSGRFALAELFEVDDEFAQMIQAKAPYHDFVKTLKSRKSPSLLDCGIAMVKNGITTFRELRKALEIS